MRARHMKTAHPKSYYKRVAAGALVAALLLAQVVPVFAEGGSALETGSSESIWETLVEDLLNTQEEEAPTTVGAQEISLDANKAQASADSESEAGAESEALPEDEEQGGADNAAEESGTADEEPGTETGQNVDCTVNFNEATGTYTITYSIASDAEGDQVVDLAKAVEAVKNYVVENQGVDGYYATAGDTFAYQIELETDSDHIYRYKDGSFTLSAPEDNEEDEADSELIKIGTGYYNPTGTETLGTIQYTDALKSLCEEASQAISEAISGQYTITVSPLQDDNKEDGQSDLWAISNADLNNLAEYLQDKYKTGNFSTNYQAYLLEYYNAKDGTDYTTIEDLLLNNKTALAEQYGTIAGYEIDPMTGEHDLETVLDYSSADLVAINETLANTTIDPRSVAISLSLTAGEASSNYSFSSASPLKSIRNYLGAVTGQDFTSATLQDMQAYLAENATEQNNFKALADGMGAVLDNAAQYDSQGTTAYYYANIWIGLYEAATEEDAVEDYLTRVLKNATSPYTRSGSRLYYNRYYLDETLRNVFHVETEAADHTSTMSRYDVATGTTTTSTQYDYTQYLYYIYTLLGEDNDFNAENFYKNLLSFAYGDEDAIAALAEKYGDSWSLLEAGLTIGDYTEAEEAEGGVWQTVNDYFKSLTEAGITKEDAASLAFVMALNLDGPLTGNEYMGTKWAWENYFTLYQSDGDLAIRKEDEAGNALAGAGFELWEIKTTTNEDGEEVTVKEYFFGTPVYEQDEDGNDTDTILYYKGVFHTKDDETESCVLYTDAAGNLHIRFLDAENDDGGKYYLQEVVAPDGYVPDENAHEIVIEAGETTEITLINYKQKATTPETRTEIQETTTETNETTTTVEDTLVPAAELPELADALFTEEGLGEEEPLVPLASGETINASVPETGDDTPLWTATALLALLGLLALAAADRKKPCKH